MLSSKLLVLASALALAAAAPTEEKLESLDRAACTACPAGWTSNNSFKKCYIVGSNRYTWDGAQTYCAGVGGRLSEPSFSTSEWSYISAFVPRRSNADEQVLWLGARRQNGPRGRTWYYRSSGATFDQGLIDGKWGKSQPDAPSTANGVQQLGLSLALYRSWTAVGFDDTDLNQLNFPLCEQICT